MRPGFLAGIFWFTAVSALSPAEPGWIACICPVEVHTAHGDFSLADAMIAPDGWKVKGTFAGNKLPYQQSKCSVALTVVTQHVNDPLERRVYDATVDQVGNEPGHSIEFVVERDPVKVSSFSQLRGILVSVSDCARAVPDQPKTAGTRHPRKRRVPPK